MARQTSILKLEGTIGDFCFYKTKHGYFVRSKGSIPRRRIKYDPGFARVRENNDEFGKAAQAVKLFRAAFRPLLKRGGDKGQTGRLVSAMMKVIKADQVNPRGQRTVTDGQPLLLEGYEFNRDRALGDALRAPISASIDRASGAMKIAINGFSPARMITAPEGATHFRFFSGGAAIDFVANNYYFAASDNSGYLPLSKKKTGPIQITQNVTSPSSRTLILLLGIEFVQVVNGEEIPMGNSGGNALAVVKVSNR